MLAYRSLGATLVGLSMILLAPAVGVSQEKRLFRAISELSDDDTFSMPGENVVAACSAVLQNRQTATPEDVCMALKRRGISYTAMGKDSAARADLDALCQLRPNDADAHRLRAMVLADLHCPLEAEEEMKTAIALNPKAADYYACLATILFLRRELQAGLRQARRAVEIDSHCASGHYILGWLSFETGANRACVEHLNKYLELRPWSGWDSARPYYIRGLALLELNRPREALKQSPHGKEAKSIAVHCGLVNRRDV